MKSFPILLLAACCITTATQAQKTIKVNPIERSPSIKMPGRSIVVTGNKISDGRFGTVILHGTNFDVAARGMPAQNTTLLTEVAKSNANAVRLPWYPSTIGAAYALPNLSLYLTQCRSLQLLPIVSFNAVTCNNSTTDFQNKAMAFWLSDAVKKTLQPVQSYLIINIANEWGFADWATDKNGSLATYTSTYIAAIKALRAAGYTCPLLIDAPDGGSNEVALLQVMNQLYAADVTGNLVFSVHAYWNKYNGNLGQIPKQLAALNASGKCILLGELANQQDSGPVDCKFNLDMKDSSIMEKVLLAAKANDIGWLAWEWHNDGCPNRDLTTDGNFTNLTPQGQKIINDPRFGLLHIANKKAAN